MRRLSSFDARALPMAPSCIFALSNWSYLVSLAIRNRK
jgi:hypothetical protein